MNVVDSSGWIEYFTDGPNAGFFAASIENIEDLLVPSLTIYEVFKWISRERGEAPAVKAVAHMQQGEVVDLDAKLAAYAARLSLQTKLPMADSIVHATAHAREATLWTHALDTGRRFRGVRRREIRRQKEKCEMKFIASEAEAENDPRDAIQKIFELPVP